MLQASALSCGAFLPQQGSRQECSLKGYQQVTQRARMTAMLMFAQEWIIEATVLQKKKKNSCTTNRLLDHLVWWAVLEFQRQTASCQLLTAIWGKLPSFTGAFIHQADPITLYANWGVDFVPIPWKTWPHFTRITMSPFVLYGPSCKECPYSKEEPSFLS